jgi:hypothetical protein
MLRNCPVANFGHDTFNISLTGSDGSTLRMHAADHLSTNAQGQIVVAFEKANCF